jgi:ERCC4-type nuclease
MKDTKFTFSIFDGMSPEEISNFINKLSTANSSGETKEQCTKDTKDTEESVQEESKQVVPVVETIDSVIGQHLKFMDSPANIGENMEYIVDTLNKLQQFKLGWISCVKQGN